MPRYADVPAVRRRQIATDVAVLVWCVVWLRGAWVVREQVLRLRGPGVQLENAGTGLSGDLGSAARRAGDIPLAGGSIGRALRRAAGAAGTLADAGREQQHVVSSLALVLCLVVAVLPVTGALVRWLPPRIGWARDAEAARRLAGHEAGLHALALRAVTVRPISELGALPPAVLAGWRSGDPASVRALASLELGGLGVDPGAGIGTG